MHLLHTLLIHFVLQSNYDVRVYFVQSDILKFRTLPRFVAIFCKLKFRVYKLRLKCNGFVFLLNTYILYD